MRIRMMLSIAAVLLLIVFLLISTLLRPSARNRAETHLLFIHDAIEKLHPIFIEENTAQLEFRIWHRDALKHVAPLLDHVKTSEDEDALLRFYMTGYGEPHLGGALRKSIIDYIFFKKNRWAGWMIQPKGDKFEVVYSLDDPNTPPVGATITHCDGIDINTLLRTHYAPYFDRRWHIVSARLKASTALTLDTERTHILNRPNFNQCEFVVNGERKSFALKWQNQTAENKKNIGRFKPHYRPHSYQKYYKNGYWVNLHSFSLTSRKAYEAHKKLLFDLSALENIDLVVFDIRGNGGGDSSIGYQVLNSVLNERQMNYINTSYQTSTGENNAFFRASTLLSIAWNEKKRKTIRAQGVDSSTVQILDNQLSHLSKALANNEPSFWQYEKQNKTVLTTNDDTATLEWGKDKTKYIVVTDSYCFSSCLNFMDLVKQIPDLIHVGLPTNADTAYTEIGRLTSDYKGQSVNFQVPIKKWNKRIREDNEAYIPNIIYSGNIYDNKALKTWLFDQIGGT